MEQALPPRVSEEKSRLSGEGTFRERSLGLLEDWSWPLDGLAGVDVGFGEVAEWRVAVGWAVGRLPRLVVEVLGAGQHATDMILVDDVGGDLFLLEAGRYFDLGEHFLNV